MTLREDVVRLIHEGSGVREFSLRAAKLVSRSVGFDGVAVMTMDPATSLVTGAVVQNGLPADATGRMIEIEHREGDVNTFAALARSGRLASSLHLETCGELDRSVRHRELRAPHRLRRRAAHRARERFGDLGWSHAGPLRRQHAVLGRGRRAHGLAVALPRRRTEARDPEHGALRPVTWSGLPA